MPVMGYVATYLFHMRRYIVRGPHSQGFLVSHFSRFFKSQRDRRAILACSPHLTYSRFRELPFSKFIVDNEESKTYLIYMFNAVQKYIFEAKGIAFSEFQVQ